MRKAASNNSFSIQFFNFFKFFIQYTARKNKTRQKYATSFGTQSYIYYRWRKAIAEHIKNIANLFLV
jgi:hypothetical protein